MLSRFAVLCFSSRPLSTNKPQRKLRVTSSTFRTQRSSPTSQERVNKQRGREVPTASVIQMVDSVVIQWDSKDPVNGFFGGWEIEGLTKGFLNSIVKFWNPTCKNSSSEF